MTEKELLIEEIINSPVSYGLHWGLVVNGKWDEDKLPFLEIWQLRNYNRDIKTFERNKKQLNGE